MREHAIAKREARDADLSLAWHIAGLQRAKRLPRLRSLFSRRRKGPPARTAPSELTPERAGRIARLAAGLTINLEDAYEREGGSDDDDD